MDKEIVAATFPALFLFGITVVFSNMLACNGWSSIGKTFIGLFAIWSIIFLVLDIFVWIKVAESDVAPKNTQPKF